MKTFASTATIIAALACGAYACMGKGSGARTSTLPDQFNEPKPWKVELCNNLPNKGTGLVVGDTIEIEERVGLEITLVDQTPRNPKPLELENATLSIVHPKDAPARNVLTETDYEDLCAGGPEKFIGTFDVIRHRKDIKLTYLIGISDLHGDGPALIVFLPYVLKGAENDPQQFLLAVVSLSDHGDEKAPEEVMNHNGIVHGHP